MDRLLDFLQREKPDILLCQEAYNGSGPALLERQRSIEVIQDNLGFTHADFAPAMRSKKTQLDQGNAVFSRFPIKEREVIFIEGSYREQVMDDPKEFPNLPRNLQLATLDTPAGDITVANFHGVWDLNGDNFSEKRRQMSETIIAATKDKPNIILAGDTNAKSTNQAMRNIEQHLTSVFGTSLATTFNMRRKDNPGYATAPVDLMFVSPNVQIVSKNCPDIDVSDHLPLIAELVIT